ncbi:DUF2290 domain-containing protein [Micromonospora wenchangensis]
MRDQVQNVVDYMLEADLLLHANSISLNPHRVTWHAHDTSAPFLTGREQATFEQYMQWLESGNYTAVLHDASLLQITYDFTNSAVVGHRLAYVPCPFILDPDLLKEGVPIADVIDAHRGDESSMALRSPVRFDYDPRSAKPGHPAAHMTINSVDCRIACVAPMHVLRFVDFVFRHFYGKLWTAHMPFFSNGSESHLGERVLAEDDQRIPHLMWNLSPNLSSFELKKRRSA